MTSRVDLHVRPHKTIVTNADNRLVQDGQTEVGKEPFPHADMLAVVAVKRLVNERVLIGLAENLLKHGVACREVRRQQVVVLLAQYFHIVQFLQQLRVTGIVQFARQHLLFLGHGVA